MKKKIVIKSKVRFTVFMILIILTIISTYYTIMIEISKDIISLENSELIEVKIMENDTLWEISKEYSKDVDLRGYIYKVCEINNIEPEDIKAGDSILVPKVSKNL